jgi:hypothetical protein
MLADLSSKLDIPITVCPTPEAFAGVDSGKARGQQDQQHDRKAEAVPS